MCSSWSRVTLIALCSMSLTIKSYGELIVVRHAPKIESGSRVQELTCMSEDDGSALIWNGWPKDLKNVEKFNEYCGSNRCLQWSEHSKFVIMDSGNYQTGPVFHYPFEDFPDRQDFSINLKEPGGIIFSARGSGEIHLPLSGKNNAASNYCFNITLVGSHASQELISSCVNNASGGNTIVAHSSKEVQKFVVNKSEWSTYIIEWASRSVDNDGADEPVSGRNMFFRKPYKLHFRIHNYTYFKMNESDQFLTATNITLHKGQFCLEFMINFCADCYMLVAIAQKNSNQRSRRITRENFLDFSPWYLKKLNISLNADNENPITLRIIGKTHSQNATPWWAVGPNIRLCESENNIRKYTIKSDQSDVVSGLWCQKLSTNESSVVHATTNITNNIRRSSEKFLQRVRELCKDFGSNGSCNGMSICDSNGCTCAAGLKGKDCNEDCPEGHYGYNCRARCDSCKNYTCNSINGTCTSDCRKHYLYPNCTEMLERPVVSCISKTGVRMNYTSKFDGKNSTLHFEIKKGVNWIRVNISLDRPEGVWSDESIEILKLNKEYVIRAVVGETKSRETRSEEARFNTECWQPSEPESFSAIPRDNGTMTLKWKHQRKFWEETEGFEVRLEPLDSKLKQNSSHKFLHASRNPSTKEPTGYHIELSLETKKNYKFSIQTKDKLVKNSNAVEVLYLLPDEISAIGEQPINSTRKSIDVKLAIFENDTDKSIINVIMKRSLTCPNLKRNQGSIKNTHMLNTQKGSNEYRFKDEDVVPGSLEISEYSACPLHLNETYSFLIVIEESGLWQMIWFIIPTSAACCLLGYILYRKRKGVSISSKSCFLSTDSNTPLQLVDVELDEIPFDSCVSPELQKLRNFENYVKRAAENGVLQQQFMLLPRGLIRPCEYGRLPNNKPKNRYGNLIAYDETRVPLITDANNLHSDYINASYIEGYAKTKAYIATQGPLPETIVDFWRMIWQEEVRVICMLVDLVEGGKSMCERYWPEVGEEMEYGDVVVLTMKQSVYADYTYRTFLVRRRRGTELQTIQHLQYTGWPEEGVPMYSHSVVDYLNKLLSVPPGQGPIVVHCTAGTGRTGAIILCDIVLRYLAAEGTVDVFAAAKKMYTGRANMLASLGQYVLAHLVPTQCLLMLATTVMCADITQEKVEEMKKDLPLHIARLGDSSWMDKALRPLEPLRPPRQENILKNRFPKLTPVGPSLVTLSRYPSYDIHSDYISAVSVDGAKIKKQYLASQLPMPSTRTDFWRLIVEKNIELIIILQRPDLDDETCCDVVPPGTTLIPMPSLKVETKASLKSSKYFTTDKLLLTDTSENPVKTRDIIALTCNNWSLEQDARPPKPEALVELWLASEKIQRPKGRALVLCYDGLTGCGLYLALSFMLDRMGVEQECDVILAVRAIRRSRPEFVGPQWQFEYLYDAAVKYVESFQLYDNFTRRLISSQEYE